MCGHDVHVGAKEDAGTCDVLVFGGRINNVLTYRNPDNLQIGSLVTVPYGKQRRTGIITGHGTYGGDGVRDIERFHGFVLSREEFDSLEEVGRGSMLSLNQTLERVAPRLIDTSCVSAEREPCSTTGGAGELTKDTLLYLSPALDKHEETAKTVRHLASRGQVILVCPTKRDAGRMHALIEGSALLWSPDSGGSYARFLSGESIVGIVARGGVLYRGHDVKSIVVMDPGSRSYIEQHRPHLNAAELAKSRSVRENLLFVAVGKSATARVLRGLVLKTSPGYKPPSLEFVARTRGIVPPALQSSIAATVKRGGRACVVSDEHTSQICTRCHRVASEAECPKCGGTEKSVVGVLREDIRKTVAPGVDVMTRKELLDSAGLYDVLVVRDAHLGFSRASFSPYQDTLNSLSEVASMVSSGGKIVMLSHERYREKLGGLKTWGSICRAVARESGRGDMRITLEITSEKRPKVVSGQVRWRGPIEGENKKGRCWRWMTFSSQEGMGDVQENLDALAKKYTTTWSIN